MSFTPKNWPWAACLLALGWLSASAPVAANDPPASPKAPSKATADKTKAKADPDEAAKPVSASDARKKSKSAAPAPAEVDPLDTLRELFGYEYRVTGNRIFIYPNTVQTRLYRINYLPGRRQGASDIRVSSSAMTSGATTANGTTARAPSPAARPLAKHAVSR